MRRLGVLSCCLAVALLAPRAALGAEQEVKDQGPSLEYRPPRPVLPEPKSPTPAPPVAIFKKTIGGLGIGTGLFDTPRDVVFDADRNLYVLDAGNNRIQKFDANGNFLLSWGESGTRAGQFNDPHALALVLEGAQQNPFLYVVDTGNNRIQKFQIQTLPRDASLCSRENVVVKEGTTQVCFVASWGSLGSRSGDFKAPRDIAFDGDGGVFIVDSGNDRIQKFDTAGRFVMEFGRTFGSGSRGGTFSGLESITWSDERFGYLYLLSEGCLVQQFEMDGQLVTSWPAAVPGSGLCVPARIRSNNRDVYLYVLDSGNGMLARFERDGRFLNAMRGAEHPFDKPTGFGMNVSLIGVPDASGAKPFGRGGLTGTGEFAVADTGNNTVQTFTLR
jgi:hypothetical protein